MTVDRAGLSRRSLACRVRCLRRFLEASELSIAEARREFSSLVREAENGRAVRITRRGEPGAQLIGHREFERLVWGRCEFVAADEEFSKSHDLEDLHLNADEVFRDSRTGSAGSDVSL